MLPCIVCSILLAVIGVASYFTGMYIFAEETNILLLSVNPQEVVFETDEKFLSVALDTSFMRCLFHNLSDGDWKKLEELSRLLAPAYLRFGGTDADRTIFSFDANDSDLLTNSTCSDDSPGNITITGKDWLKINEFARKSELDLILDLNVLLRKGPEWDNANAKAVLDFSEENGLALDFQLGNEPNSFPHVFETTVTGTQLARDFSNLKNLLRSRESYRNSKLIGPEVTRPKHLEGPSLKYLNEFLSGNPSVDVVSWHQYYLNGRTATLEDFVNPETFDVLSPQIRSISEVVRKHFKDLPIWISETSSAYGSGAPKLSNRFAASFLWLDKLGTAAKLGMSVVVRQSLFKGEYALINDLLSPTPDFWISFFYKNIVGRKVLGLNTKAIQNRTEYLRFYCHCMRSNATSEEAVKGKIVIYGMNLSNETELVATSGLSVVYPVRAYVFRAEFNNLKEKTVLLNSNRLVYKKTTFNDLVQMGNDVEFPLVLPSLAIGFWVLNDSQENACGT